MGDDSQIMISHDGGKDRLAILTEYRSNDVRTVERKCHAEKGLDGGHMTTKARKGHLYAYFGVTKEGLPL